MYVRVLTGYYAGEVRDIRPDAARQMLTDGRAVDPETPPPLPSPPLSKKKGR